MARGQLAGTDRGRRDRGPLIGAGERARGDDRLDLVAFAEVDQADRIVGRVAGDGEQLADVGAAAEVEGELSAGVGEGGALPDSAGGSTHRVDSGHPEVIGADVAVALGVAAGDVFVFHAGAENGRHADAFRFRGGGPAAGATGESARGRVARVLGLIGPCRRRERHAEAQRADHDEPDLVPDGMPHDAWSFRLPSPHQIGGLTKKVPSPYRKMMMLDGWSAPPPRRTPGAPQRARRGVV